MTAALDSLRQATVMPCPCGGAADETHSSSGFDILFDVHCQMCGVQMRAYSKGDARDRWNKFVMRVEERIK